jgi:hypothetical protein
MRLTVADLIEALQEIADAGHADLEVRLATQPSWPLQHHLSRDIGLRAVSDRDETLAVYLLEAGQVYDMPYAPAGIFKGRLEETPREVYCPECERTDVRRVEGTRYVCNRCGTGEEFDARDLPYDDE